MTLLEEIKMNANIIKKTIEMSKNEAKKAGKIDTKEFKELRAYQEIYPTFTIDIKAPAKRKNEFKGLTYDYMKSYIKKHDDEDGEKMKQFLKLIGQDEDVKEEGSEALEVAGYLDVRDWFLKQFPDIKKSKENRREEIKKILASAA